MVSEFSTEIFQWPSTEVNVYKRHFLIPLYSRLVRMSTSFTEGLFELDVTTRSKLNVEFLAQTGNY